MYYYYVLLFTVSWFQCILEYLANLVLVPTGLDDARLDTNICPIQIFAAYLIF